MNKQINLNIMSTYDSYSTKILKKLVCKKVIIYLKSETYKYFLMNLKIFHFFYYRVY